jgi:hypothetical protein
VPEQSAETRVANDLLIRFKRIVDIAPITRERPISHPLMRPEDVIEVDVGRHEEVRVLLAKDDEMIETFVLGCFDDPLY